MTVSSQNKENLPYFLLSYISPLELKTVEWKLLWTHYLNVFLRPNLQPEQKSDVTLTFGHKDGKSDQIWTIWSHENCNKKFFFEVGAVFMNVRKHKNTRRSRVDWLLEDIYMVPNERWSVFSSGSRMQPWKFEVPEDAGKLFSCQKNEEN